MKKIVVSVFLALTFLGVAGKDTIRIEQGLILTQDQKQKLLENPNISVLVKKEFWNVYFAVNNGELIYSIKHTSPNSYLVISLAIILLLVFLKISKENFYLQEVKKVLEHSS